MARAARAWPALALVALLSGCIGAVAIPLVVGGGLSARAHHRVKAATQTPTPKHKAPAATKKGKAKSEAAKPKAVLTSLTELPPPSALAAGNPDDPWQAFFAYASAQADAADKRQSALLVDPPSIDAPVRRNCTAQVPAVVIDLDDDPAPFAPQKLVPAPPGVAAGLAALRGKGVVVLWISRLPSARVAEVAGALKASGLDPQGQDQLLLIRNGDDRKQALRMDANSDVCVVAIAGDQRGDFDELFDYLRNPGGAVGLYPMMGNGWFLVPSLEASPVPASTDAPSAG
jgi:hypothetical protein